MSIKKFIFFLVYTMVMHAAPGCMDNSWHMCKPFDNKNYHLVSRHYSSRHATHCQCSCRHISLDRGYCTDCGHYRDLQPWVIVRPQAAR